MLRTSKKVKALRRLIWAGIDRPDTRSGSWSARAIEAGIIVSYARPFEENTGLGPLPRKFREFEDRGYQITHDGMLRSRDVMEADTNLLERPSNMSLDDVSDVTEIEITVNERGGATWSAIPPRLPEEYFGYIVKLIDFQEDRLEKEALRIGNELADENGRRPGTYRLGVDFP